MSRLLSVLLAVALLIAPAFAAGMASCRHQTQAHHDLASASSDLRAANVAATEETAAGLARKGKLADIPAAPLFAAAAVGPMLVVPSATAEPLRPWTENEGMPQGTSIPPLLEPPAA